MQAKYETKFGYFIREKRLSLEEYVSKSDFARRLGITRKYLEELEKGKKPAPEQELLIKMVQIFKLDENEKGKALFFELAEKSKENDIPNETPLLDDIGADESIRDALNIIRKFATKEDLEEFADKLKKRNTGREMGE